MKVQIITFLFDMVSFLKFTVKNVWRNRRRTMITMAGICVGTVTMILLQSYVNTIDIGLKAEAVQKQYGHLQIAAKGYFDADENSPDHMMSAKVVNKIVSQALSLDSVDFVNTRVHLTGIIGTQKTSTVFSAIAGIPQAEGVMAPTIIKGKLLAENDPTGILIGEAMAKKLGVDTGDSLIAFVSTGGSQEAIAVTVRGIYDALMPEMEKVIIYMPVNSAWDLMLDKKVHRILLFLNDPEKLNQTIGTMKDYIRKNEFNVEVRDWSTLAVFLKQIVGMFQGMIMVIGLIVFIVIIFNIQNTMHMAIHERFREIGAMRAMGSSRFEIVKVFIAEGFCIGLFGAILGIAFALIFIPWVNSMHFHLPPGPGQDKPTPVVFTPTNVILLNSLLVNLFTAFIASISPAIKGAKIRIYDALRYV